MKAAIGFAYGVFVLATAQPASSQPVWKAVPHHKGAFVDIASIVHMDVSHSAYKRCVATPLHGCLPPVDTKADVRVDGETAKGVGFYCKDVGVTRGDMHFGQVGDKDRVFPLNAAQTIVCADARRSAH